MQGKMLDQLDAMFTNASEDRWMISKLGGPDQKQRARILNVMKCGLLSSRDPFLFSCCLAIRAHQLFGLRMKARIFVNDGVVLMGGLDVLNVIPEFCVFVQVRKSDSEDRLESDGFEIIVGPVMVTKHPVMHPGDVRMLLAVDVPQLRNHKNVILFSQRGDRPEADKMSGSDLDGDQFAVTWDPRLFLGTWKDCSKAGHERYVSRTGQVIFGTDDASVLQDANTDPMEYAKSTPPAAPVDLPMTDERLMQHFIDFAKNDKLGAIGMLLQIGRRN